MPVENLRHLPFPDTPLDVAKDDRIRAALVKGNAYITFALEEADVSHTRDLDSAMVTASTHNLPLDLTPQEYLERSVQELAHAEAELEDKPDFQELIMDVRKAVESEM